MLVTQKVSGSVAVMGFYAGVELQLLCECHCFTSTIKATSTCHYHLSCPVVTGWIGHVTVTLFDGSHGCLWSVVSSVYAEHESPDV